MKKLFLTLLTALIGLSASAVTPEELEAFLPVAEKINAGNYAAGIAAAEAIGEKNKLAGIMLYLIYSRGDCGTAVDYAKTVKYYNLMFPSGFTLDEYRDYWQRLRFPPTDREKSVTIKAWRGENNFFDATIPLKGKYPLKQCYQEEMENIGKVAARAIFVAAQTNATPPQLRKRMMELAREMGNASVLFWPGIFSADASRGVKPEQYQRILTAMKAGHLPSKMMAAAILQDNTMGIALDPATAGDYLRDVVKKCQSYEAIGCTHARKDRGIAETMLKSVPDCTLPTAQLIEALRQAQRKGNQDQRLINALNTLIIQRNDHPDCDFVKAMTIPLGEREKRLKLMVSAAEKGSRDAIRKLIDENNAPNSDRWYYLYLAGKNGMPQSDPNQKQDYYQQAYRAIQDARPFAAGRSFKKELALLAEHCPAAKAEYQREFGGENQEPGITFKSSDPENIAVEWITVQDRKIPRIKVKQTDTLIYLDVFIKPLPGAANCYFMLSSPQSDLSTGMVWADVVLSDKTRRTLGVRQSFYGKRPERMRINVAPGERTFELQIEIR